MLNWARMVSIAAHVDRRTLGRRMAEGSGGLRLLRSGLLWLILWLSRAGFKCAKPRREKYCNSCKGDKVKLVKMYCVKSCDQKIVAW